MLVDAAQPYPHKGAKPVEPGLLELWRMVRPSRTVILTGVALVVVNRTCGLMLPASTKILIDEVVAKRNVDVLLPLAAALLGAGLVQGLTSGILLHLVSKSAQRTIARLRRSLQAHIGRLSLSFHDSQKTGSLVSRIMTDVEGARNIIGTGFIALLGGLVTAALALAIMISISPFLTVIAVALTSLLTGLIYKEMGVMRPLSRDQSRIQAQVNGRLQESLAGIRVVKAYRAEAREAAVFSAGIERMVNAAIRSLNANATMYFLSSLLMAIAGTTIMYLGAGMILNGSITLGSFLTFTAMMACLSAPVLQVTNICGQLSQAMTGLERAHELLRLPAEENAGQRTVAIPPISGEIEFQEVSFSYRPGVPVLDRVSFRAGPGTVTALVGPSGAGKSTITALAASFYQPGSGRILVDGIDLSTVTLDSYRTQMAMVLQDPFLFEGSIRDNVAFSRPEASGREILEACRLARVDEFAEAMPQRYDTLVGERGAKLSGGQRQRVSIARAILADPRILILDEATSSLDSESEALIQEALKDLMRGRTTFVIAHRLSTIQRADQILVVEAGQIIERGTGESLYAARGRYFDLYTKQYNGGRHRPRACESQLTHSTALGRSN
ncbi:MAG: ABC transporter ATP-binding protein [Bryobacterales bacterium]|nr:ABC transporter ATP-binding protein [Bryobacterales bacterium]